MVFKKRDWQYLLTQCRDEKLDLQKELSAAETTGRNVRTALREALAEIERLRSYQETPLARFQRLLGQRTAELMKEYHASMHKHIGSLNINIIDVKTYDDPTATVVGLVTATERAD